MAEMQTTLSSINAARFKACCMLRVARLKIGSAVPGISIRMLRVKTASKISKKGKMGNVKRVEDYPTETITDEKSYFQPDGKDSTAETSRPCPSSLAIPSLRIACFPHPRTPCATSLPNHHSQHGIDSPYHTQPIR